MTRVPRIGGYQAVVPPGFVRRNPPKSRGAASLAMPVQDCGYIGRHRA